MGLARTLIVVGLILVAAGVLLLMFGARLPGHLGRLPGDIVIRRKNSVFYFPLVTCLLISVVLSFLAWLFGRR